MNRDIPEHEHTHSVGTYCLNCYMLGIGFPLKFMDAQSCGNCGSMETYSLYPACCIIADREYNNKALTEARDVIEQAYQPGSGRTLREKRWLDKYKDLK